MIGVDDDVLTAERGHVEFLSTDACEADGLPDTGDIGLLGSVESELVFLEVDVGLSQLLVVLDALVEDLSSLVELVIKATITALFNISLVWIADEGLEVAQELLSTLGVCEDELVVHTLVFHVGAGHQEISDELLGLVLLLGQLNNLLKLAGISTLDESINGGNKSALGDLCFTKLRPDLWLVCLLSELSGLSNVVKFVQNDFDGVHGLVELLVDAKSLRVELMLVVQGHGSELVAIVVV